MIHAYIKLSTLEYPLYEGDIRLEHPQIAQGATGDNFPCPPTFAPVIYVDHPQYDINTQTIKEEKPVQVNGVWQTSWSIVTLTPEQIEANIAYAKSIGVIKDKNV